MALIIGFMGERLGGKDTAAEYLAEKHGAEHLRYSHIFDDILRILDMPISRRNEIDLGNALRQQFGSGIFSQAMRKRVRDSKSPLIAMNGMRFPKEMDVARELDTKIVYITAPEQVRYQRFLARQEKADDATMTYEKFHALDRELTEVQIPELGKQADFRIDNTGSVQDLYDKIEQLLTDLNYAHP
jgi:dephospho-CoA kinase